VDFFADDDIRINSDFIKQVFDTISVYGAEAVSIHCAKEDEKRIYNTVFQWISFGSGCSFVISQALKKCSFLWDMNLVLARIVILVCN